MSPDFWGVLNTVANVIGRLVSVGEREGGGGKSPTTAWRSSSIRLGLKGQIPHFLKLERIFLAVKPFLQASW